MYTTNLCRNEGAGQQLPAPVMLPAWKLEEPQGAGKSRLNGRLSVQEVRSRTADNCVAYDLQGPREAICMSVLSPHIL